VENRSERASIPGVGLEASVHAEEETARRLMSDSGDAQGAGTGTTGQGLSSSAPAFQPRASAAEWKPSWAQPSTSADAPTEDSQPAPSFESSGQGGIGAASEGAVEPVVLNEVKPVVSLSAEKTEAEVNNEEEANDFANEDEVVDQTKGQETVKPQMKSADAKPNEAEAATIAIEIDPSKVAKDIAKGKEMVEGTDKRPHINIVTLGHVDAGKSTLSGSILYITGKVDKRTIEKFEQEAKERGRESWFLAYIMDESEEERAKGKTVEVGRATYETDSRRFTILDAPGHKNYVPAMISGASQADAGILVISARKGEFESGLAGQTLEHVLLAKTLGITRLIVVINKMDESTVKWDQNRYEDICKKLRPMLKKSGYKVKRDVQFLPISALQGINVKDPITEEQCAWATELNGGKSLLQLLDELKIPNREEDKPLRVTIVDKFLERGVNLIAKVEAGILYKGQKVLCCPNMIESKVESIMVDEEEVDGARPGENVLLKLVNLQENEVGKGHVISSALSPVQGCKEIIAQLFIVTLLEHRPLFSAGYNCVFHCHTVEEESTVYGIVAELDNAGKITKKEPPFAKANTNVVARIRLEKSVCVEPYDKTPQLGRFTLRDEGSTIAIGIVKKCR